MASRVTSVVLVVAAAFLAAWAVHADDSWFALHWLRHQCFVDAASRWEAMGARVLAVVVALLLLWVRPRAAKVKPATWLGVAVAIVASVGFCDLVLRWTRSRRPVPPPGPPGLWIYHERRQAFDVAVDGRNVHYALDEHGYRVREDSGSVDLTKPSILLAGESVAFGFGLEWDDTIAARLEHRTGMQVANLAMSGVSSAGTLLRLRTELPKFEKPVAVVIFVVHTWIERETDRRLFWVDWREGPSIVPKSPEPPSESPVVQLWTSLFRYHDDHRFDIAREAFRQQAALVRARGAKPLFVFTECGARCQSQDFVAKQLTQDLDAPYVWVDVPLAENLDGDMHPGPTGARRYAVAIEEALSR